MPSITIVGLGPGPRFQLTGEAEQELFHADKVFFRTAAHPVYDWLQSLGKQLVSFDLLYTLSWKKPGELYEFIVDALFKETALRGKALYAVPGNPYVLESTTMLVRSRAAAERVEMKVVHGLSFVEVALAEITGDLVGVQIVLPLTNLQTGHYCKDFPLLVCQIEAKGLPLNEPRVDLTMRWLLNTYPSDHPVTLIWTDGLPSFETQSKIIGLKHLAREYGEAKFSSSLYVPPL